MPPYLFNVEKVVTAISIGFSYINGLGFMLYLEVRFPPDAVAPVLSTRSQWTSSRR